LPPEPPLAFSFGKENKDKAGDETMDMELTKMTAKGQITLPVAIRRRLNLKTGDKVGFITDADGIRIVNVSTLAFERDKAVSPPGNSG
jgi:AbrB family looped-hinge helix DNA binding protein